MDLAAPRCISREEIFAARPERARNIRFGKLWVVGSLDALARPTVAIVGSRAPSDGGRARARLLGAELAARGVCVVSGLALGIDAAAHAGAVDRERSTIAVLGGGHLHFFPHRNRELAGAMLANGGAVLSPFGPDEPARPGQFLERNAVVAALADRVVVVEAAERSGALNTAGWAAHFGIDVLAFPGDVDRAVSAGCNELIRDGAMLVRGSADVFESLGMATEANAVDKRATLRARYASDANALLVIDALASDDRSTDALAGIVSLTTAETLSTIVRLEIAGAIERRDGTNFGLVG